jgi:hypothetical protein
VPKAQLVLVVLICVSPVFLLLDGPIVCGLVAGATATGLAIVALTMRPRETAFFLSIAYPAAAIVSVPAVLMLVQVLPLKALAHPIWQSAEIASGQSLTGGVSVDIGAGLIALGQYLTIAAIGFWSGAVAVDRRRAEWVLFSVMAATAFIGLLIAANELLGLTILSAAFAPFKRMQAVDCAALGIIVSAAAALRTVERYETRHAGGDRSSSILITTFAACVAAFVVCLGALILAAEKDVLLAAGCGAAALLWVVTIRRLGLGLWGAAAMVVPFIALATVSTVSNPALRSEGVLLSFAEDSSAPIVSMTRRMLADAPLLGTGAGSFTAMAPIYRSLDEQTLPATAPTAAATMAIEMGSPLLWLIVLTTAGAIYFLLRAALRRGRDSFYPMAGAGSLVVLALLGFINSGILGSVAAMIAAATIGLALAQSKSRTAAN